MHYYVNKFFFDVVVICSPLLLFEAFGMNMIIWDCMIKCVKTVELIYFGCVITCMCYFGSNWYD